MQHTLTYLANTDALISCTMEALYDGTDTPEQEQLPLVPLTDLVFRLSPRVCPMLGQMWELFPHSERRPTTRVRVEGVVRMNTFELPPEDEPTRPPRGGNDDKSDPLGFKKGTGLFPAVALINHEKEPNCSHRIVVDNIMVVWARRTIEAGEEITLSYSNKDTSKWF
eukprot:8944218-Pyramimonas_sp.AAC.1